MSLYLRSSVCIFKPCLAAQKRKETYCVHLPILPCFCQKYCKNTKTKEGGGGVWKASLPFRKRLSFWSLQQQQSRSGGTKKALSLATHPTADMAMVGSINAYHYFLYRGSFWCIFLPPPSPFSSLEMLCCGITSIQKMHKSCMSKAEILSWLLMEPLRRCWIFTNSSLLQFATRLDPNIFKRALERVFGAL